MSFMSEFIGLFILYSRQLKLILLQYYVSHVIKVFPNLRATIELIVGFRIYASSFPVYSNSLDEWRWVAIGLLRRNKCVVKPSLLVFIFFIIIISTGKKSLPHPNNTFLEKRMSGFFFFFVTWWQNQFLSHKKSSH